VQRYSSSLKSSSELPEYVTNIKTPDGLVLAANYRYNNYELEGDIQALRLVDLDREGLIEYRNYLQGLGISYNPDASIDGTGSFGLASIYSTGGGGSSTASSAIALEIFNSINLNGDNSISLSEAERAFSRLNSRLGRNYTEADVRAFISRFDTNRDGQLSFDEFKRIIFQIIG
jgi:Ca2+-binding EF-hand superfamily protein